MRLFQRMTQVLICASVAAYVAFAGEAPQNLPDPSPSNTPVHEGPPPIIPTTRPSPIHPPIHEGPPPPPWRPQTFNLDRVIQLVTMDLADLDRAPRPPGALAGELTAIQVQLNLRRPMRPTPPPYNPYYPANPVPVLIGPRGEQVLSAVDRQVASELSVLSEKDGVIALPEARARYQRMLAQLALAKKYLAPLPTRPSAALATVELVRSEVENFELFVDAASTGTGGMKSVSAQEVQSLLRSLSSGLEFAQAQTQSSFSRDEIAAVLKELSDELSVSAYATQPGPDYSADGLTRLLGQLLTDLDQLRAFLSTEEVCGG